MLLSEAFALYDQHVLRHQGFSIKTRKNYATACACFMRGIGDVSVELITVDTFVFWKVCMEQNGLQVSTIKTNMIKLRAVLKWLETRNVKVMDTTHVTMPKLVRRNPKVLVPNEVGALLSATDSLFSYDIAIRNKAIISMLFSTACRISELLQLNVDDVRDSNRPIVHGKNDKYRPVNIDITARKYLDAYLDTRDDHYAPLFMSQQRRRLGCSSVEKMLHKCASYAGLDKNVTPHLFRHSALTDYLLNGAPMQAVQQIAGHASIKTTIDTYSHLLPQDALDMAGKYHTEKY